MKKKYKTTKNILRKIFKAKSKPELCPECGEKMFNFAISCGVQCYFHYICFKCPREVVITSKDKIVANKKLTKEELIKTLKGEKI